MLVRLLRQNSLKINIILKPKIMKKFRSKTIFALLFLGLMLLPKAQMSEGKSRGKILNPGPKMPRIIFSAGYGNTMPSSSTKDAYFTNSSGISGDLFVPFLFFRKGWDGTVKGGNYGFTIGGSYNFGGSGGFGVTPNPYAVIGQTSSVVSSLNVDARNPGFRIGGGPQVNFYLMNRLLLSPIVLAEYFSTTQKTLSAVQTTQVNGQTKEYNLLTLPETKTSGFSITPKLRLSYFLAENFGIFADAGYVFGPKVNTQTSSLKPEGNPNQAGQYNQQQLDAGTQVKSEIKSTSYQAFAVNVGLSLAFGGKKGWNGMNKTDDKGWNGKTETKDKGWNGKQNTDDIKKGWNGKANVIDENSIKQKLSSKNCKIYTAPKIIKRSEFVSDHLNKGNLNIEFIHSNNISAKYKVSVWEVAGIKKNLIHEKIYPSNFNGSISGLNMDERKNVQLEVQMQALENKNVKTKNNQAIIQNSTCAQFENNGLSNVSSVSITSSCAADYEFAIDSAICVKDKKVKVFCKIKFLNTHSILLPNPTLDNVSFKDDATGLPITASAFSSSLAPLSLLPTGTFINFNFEVEGDICKKDLRITYDVKWDCPSGPQQITACQAIINLPCCYCNYCEDPNNSNIQVLENSTSLLGGDNLGIAQHFNISPKNISKVEAELVYFHEDEMDTACKVCRANESEVYTFINSNTLSWNSGAAINASAGNMSGTFPSKILNWSSNNQGNLQFNLTLALPGTAALSCCERHGTVCIRYKFTDIECKTCEYLVCYNY